MKKLLLAMLLSLTPSIALAHTGVGVTHGFFSGFTHPLTGMDHVLAMVAVGLLAAALGGRALLLVPASFVSMMLVGGVLGMNGVGVPAVELGITLSIVVIGTIIALGQRLPTGIAMTVAGAFAVFHGHAHGAEMPLGGSALGYATGFVIATASLHLAGIGLGLSIAGIGQAYSRTVVRVAGAIVAGLGLGILTGIV
jgi:urease accessory protein